MLTYDAVSFNQYLDTILATHSPPPGSTRQSQSPWLFLDAAHTIFDTAKRRVYTGRTDETTPGGASTTLPDSLRPVLEEQPKWSVLAEVLEEIERDSYVNASMQDDSNGTVLIMCSDQATCRQLREYLKTMYMQPEVPEEDDEEQDHDDDDDADDTPKPSARFIMRRKLRDYLVWKSAFAKVSASLFADNQKALNGAVDGRPGSHSYRGKGPPNKRRRIRGGSASAVNSSRTATGSIMMAQDPAGHVAGLLAEIQPTEVEAAQQTHEVVADPLQDMEDYFEMFEMNDLVVVHPYDGDMDEHVLEEVKPRYIVMYEPDSAFIRRVEVYRSSHTDRNVRVYFMYYGGSVEEQRYLSAVRREKDAFTRLIKEKAVRSLSLPLEGPPVSYLQLFNKPTNEEHGPDAHPRRPSRRRPPRTLPAYRQHAYRRGWSVGCHRRTTAGGCRRARIPKQSPLPFTRPKHRRGTVHVNGRRLRPDARDLHRAQIR